MNARAAVGVCASGQVVQNTTTGGVQCVAVTSSQWATSGSNISFSGGNVGIGTTSPNKPLTVVGDVNFTGSIVASGYNAGVWDAKVNSSQLGSYANLSVVSGLLATYSNLSVTSGLLATYAIDCIKHGHAFGTNCTTVFGKCDFTGR